MISQEAVITWGVVVIWSLGLMFLIAAVVWMWVSRSTRGLRASLPRPPIYRPPSLRSKTLVAGHSVQPAEEFLQHLKEREGLLSQGIDVVPKRADAGLISKASQSPPEIILIPSRTVSTPSSLFHDLQDFHERVSALVTEAGD